MLIGTIPARTKAASPDIEGKPLAILTAALFCVDSRSCSACVAILPSHTSQPYSSCPSITLAMIRRLAILAFFAVRIAPRAFNALVAFAHVFSACFLKLRSESRVIPRYLISSFGLMLKLFRQNTVSLGIVVLFPWMIRALVLSVASSRPSSCSASCTRLRARFPL